MRNECLNHRYVYGSGVVVERLVLRVSDKAQVYTQKAEKRPYGVGLLVAGCDAMGPHLYQTDPSGVYFDCIAQAIGARAQSAKTYLEKVYEHVEGLSREELIEHVLRAVKGASVKKLTSRNVSVGVVGVSAPDFVILEGDDVRAAVGRVTNEDDEDETEEEEKKKKERREGGGAAASGEEQKQAAAADDSQHSDMQEAEQEAKRAEEEQRKEEQSAMTE